MFSINWFDPRRNMSKFACLILADITVSSVVNSMTGNRTLSRIRETSRQVIESQSKKALNYIDIAVRGMSSSLLEQLERELSSITEATDKLPPLARSVIERADCIADADRIARRRAAMKSRVLSTVL